MRILIATGLSPLDVGGTAQYASNMARELNLMGHNAWIVGYGRVEKNLPIGFRHLYFLLKTIPRAFYSDRIIALDTFSVGIPALWASWILRKKIIVRVGGDFLWESYVNRTGEMITLPEFYKKAQSLNRKERIILYFTKILLKNAYKLAFNTEWQRKIWVAAYHIQEGKTAVTRNYIPPKAEATALGNKVFLWAGRESKVKNTDRLHEVARKVKLHHPEFSLDFATNIPYKDLMEKMNNSYAVVLPSLSDVCPNFILEAASFNKPFIMTKETGLREIYPKGGLFVDSRSSAELEVAIESLLQPQEYARFVAELKSLNPEHSWKEIAQELITL